MSTLTGSDTLNAEQRAAVESDAPFRLVVAGPGSGKTRTLVAAIERECREHGQQGIVAITYTVAAATELEERLKSADWKDLPRARPNDLNLGFCGTLHAFCLKLAREHGYLGNAQWGVLDDEQREGMVEDVMADLGVKTTVAKVLPLLDKFQGAFARTPTEIAVNEYRNRILSAGLLDFEAMLKAGAHIARRLGDRNRWPYRALFVDEAQDATAADWDCYDAFPCERKFVVGDPDQAIFGFRGGAVRELFIRANQSLVKTR